MITMTVDQLTPFATIAHNDIEGERVTLYSAPCSGVVWADNGDGTAYATDIPLADAPSAWPVDPWDYQVIDAAIAKAEGTKE